jgi:hypothetical protein
LSDHLPLALSQASDFRNIQSLISDSDWKLSICSKKRRGPGRPKTTGKGELIATPDLAIIDEFADAHDLKRGEALREIVRRSKGRKS